MIALPIFYFKDKIEIPDILALTETANNYVKEIEKPSWIIENLAEIFKTVEKFGSDLGFDIRNRIPDSSRIHLFEDKEFVKLSKNLGASIISKGFSRPVNREVLVDTEKDILEKQETVGYMHGFSELCCRIAHELIHLITYIEVCVNKNGLIDYSRYGFFDTIGNNFKLFNEGLTELTKFYLIKNYWRNSALLKKLSGLDRKKMNVAYPLSTVLVDMILEKMVNKINIPYKDILNLFQGYQIENPMEGIKYLENTLGKKETNILAGLDVQDIENTAYYLKLEPLYIELGLEEQFIILNKDPGYRFIEKL